MAEDNEVKDKETKGNGILLRYFVVVVMLVLVAVGILYCAFKTATVDREVWLEAAKTHSNMVVIVGDAHVEGICRLLGDAQVRKVRLADLMDRERMDRVRDMIWKGGQD